MPGITGFFSKASRAVSNSTLAQMVSSMIHEDFYRSGTQVHRELGTGIGWVVHEGSYSDCMPLWNDRHDICLIFVGEDFGDYSRTASGQREPRVGDTGSASTLVELYEQAGDAFFGMLNGTFAGVVIDERKREVTLFNDRHGMSRIYLHENDQGLYFASEAKALLRVLPATRQFDVDGVGEFLSVGCALQGRTLFSGISLLHGGSKYVFSPGGNLRKSVYYDRAHLEEQEPLPARDYYDALRLTWKSILPRYFHGSTLPALSLTGGVDSRMILAYLPENAVGLSSYTFAGPLRDCMDVTLSSRLAKVAHLRHFEIIFGSRFFRCFDALAEKAVYYSDGAAEVKGACDLFGQIAARKISPVRISGVYGGEILRHLVVFKPMRLYDRIFGRELRSAISKARNVYDEETKCHPLSFTAFKQAMWHLHGPLSVDRTQVTLRSPYLDRDLLELVYRAPSEAVGDSGLSLRLVSDGNPAFNGIPTDRGMAYPPVPVLTLLHHAYQEFMFRAEYAFDYGMPQWLAQVDARLRTLHLERIFLGRHKFYHFRTWYRDQLSSVIQERLLDRNTLALPYLERNGVRKMVEAHLAGRANYTLEIHKLLSLEILQRRLLDQR